MNYSITYEYSGSPHREVIEIAERLSAGVHTGASQTEIEERARCAFLDEAGDATDADTVIFEARPLAEGLRVWSAEVIGADDTTTGYHATEAEALAAVEEGVLLWYGEAERAAARCVTRDEVVDSDVIDRAIGLAGLGWSSPALGIAATA